MSTLTDREMTILRGIAAGLTYTQIARRLNLSETTVGNNARQLFRKFRARDRANLVYIACQHGLIGRTAPRRPQASTTATAGHARTGAATPSSH